MLATAILFPLIVVGALPWSRRLRNAPPQPQTRDAPVESSPQARSQSAPQPWWRTTLWISAWIILPAYGVYCRSMEEFASPADWSREFARLFALPFTHIALQSAL